MAVLQQLIYIIPDEAVCQCNVGKYLSEDSETFLLPVATKDY
jgi:hypothetical protein